MDIVKEFQLRSEFKSLDKYYLGKLCKYGHDWDGNGQSLRRKVQTHCIICEKVKHGVKPPLTVEERFWSKIDKSGECWIWTAGRETNGYGRFDAPGLPRRAHRTAWVLTYGDIPDGLHCLHHCDTPLCCNVSHLFLGTPADNVQDMINKGRKNPAIGERSGNSKLTEAEVKEIRELYFTKQCGVVELAKRFGVSRVTIRQIYTRKVWDHIP